MARKAAEPGVIKSIFSLTRVYTLKAEFYMVFQRCEPFDGVLCQPFDHR